VKNQKCIFEWDFLVVKLFYFLNCFCDLIIVISKSRDGSNLEIVDCEGCFTDNHQLKSSSLDRSNVCPGSAVSRLFT